MAGGEGGAVGDQLNLGVGGWEAEVVDDGAHFRGQGGEIHGWFRI